MKYLQFKKLAELVYYVARNYSGVILTAVKTLSNWASSQRSSKLQGELIEAVEHLKKTGSHEKLDELLLKMKR